MGKNISFSESYAISIIRVIATLLIISCHILQGYGNRWAWILNVGVQVFFFISGFLYGKKDIQDKFVWLRGRIKKIYFPYLCYLILFSPLFWMFAAESISVKKFFLHLFCLQGVVASSNIKGLDHLWFMSIIMFCYMITPVLQYLIQKYQKIFFFGLMGVYLIYLSVFNFALSYITWIIVYCLAYAIATLWSNTPKSLYFILAGGFILLWKFSSWNDILTNTQLGILLHAVGGGLIFLSLYILFSTTCVWIKKKEYLLWLDKYSFEIYLTHHVFILGPFSILYVSAYPSLNVFLAILLTLCSAFALKQFTNKISIVI